MNVLITTARGTKELVDYAARSALSAVMEAVHDDLDGYEDITRAFCEFDDDDIAIASKQDSGEWIVEWRGSGFTEYMSLWRAENEHEPIRPN